MAELQRKHQDLLDEARMTYALFIVAIAKQIAEDTGELRGEFLCPRCGHGTIRWSVAKSNRHTAVVCTTRYTAADGKQYSCTAATE